MSSPHSDRFPPNERLTTLVGMETTIDCGLALLLHHVPFIPCTALIPSMGQMTEEHTLQVFISVFFSTVPAFESRVDGICPVTVEVNLACL
jgi:hypothetical protein